MAWCRVQIVLADAFLFCRKKPAGWTGGLICFSGSGGAFTREAGSIDRAIARSDRWTSPTTSRFPFVLADDGVAAGEAVECLSANAAVMRAEALSHKPGCAGAIAFSRTGDPATGEFGDA